MTHISGRNNTLKITMDKNCNWRADTNTNEPTLHRSIPVLCSGKSIKTTRMPLKLRKQSLHSSDSISKGFNDCRNFITKCLSKLAISLVVSSKEKKTVPSSKHYTKTNELVITMFFYFSIILKELVEKVKL